MFIAVHYSRKCRCIISILEINFVSEWICSCQWNTYWASSLGTARFLTNFDSVRFYFSSKKRKGGNLNRNGNGVSKLLTLECNFIVKWKNKNLRAHLFDSVLRPIVWFTWEALPSTTHRLGSIYYLSNYYSATTWIYGSQWFTVPHVYPPTDQLSANEAVPLRLHIQTLKVLFLKMNEHSMRGFRRGVSMVHLQKVKNKNEKGSKSTVGIWNRSKMYQCIFILHLPR